MSATRVTLEAMNAKTVRGWTLGQCANCDTPLDPGGYPGLYCCEYCKSYAKDVRYFRACARGGLTKDPDIREALTIRMAHLVVGGPGRAGRGPGAGPGAGAPGDKHEW